MEIGGSTPLKKLEPTKKPAVLSKWEPRRRLMSNISKKDMESRLNK